MKNSAGADTKCIDDSGSVATGDTHFVVGLFGGIGGLERGLRRAGHETLLIAENDPAAIQVLRNRLRGSPLHGDVRTLKQLPKRTSLVAAGFPCQDLSQAGLTAGIQGKRSGLISEVFRLLDTRRVPWVLLENVPFMLNLRRGAAIDAVARGFEERGYKWAYRVVDARAFGLPQRRRRVYFLASLDGDPRQVLFADAGRVIEDQVDDGSLACGFYWTEGIRGLGWAVDAVPTLKGGSTIGIASPPAILLPDARVVTPDIRDAERLQGFPSDWTKPAELVVRKGVRWRLVGNAVCVPVAQWIGQRLKKPGVVAQYEVDWHRRGESWPAAAWNVGDGRVRVKASEWPVNLPYASLHTFLRYPCAPLSWRALSGFLSRTTRSSLNFPPRLLPTIEERLSGAPLLAT